MIGIQKFQQQRTDAAPAFRSWFLGLTASWVLFSSSLVAAGYVLSWFHHLNREGYLVVLPPIIILAAWPLVLMWKQGHRFRTGGIGRFHNPFAALYLVCLLLAIVGGAIHPPTNYDAFCYRIPRMLYWLQENHYHWIGAFCARMDFSSLGFEWLMLPGVAVLGTLRLGFLINIVSYFLMPGLLFSAFRMLGVRGRPARVWMWIIPLGSCFAMQAGSIGNDISATTYLYAAVVFALKARESGRPMHIVLAVLAAALTTCAKASNLPLLLPMGICILAALMRKPGLWFTAIPSSLAAVVISFVPLAVTNIQHTGHWTGSPNSIQNLTDPAKGFVGNCLQIASGALQPAIFPIAQKWNGWIQTQMGSPPLTSIRKSFPEMSMPASELASEEGAGIGLGVTAIAIFTFAGARLRQELFGSWNLGLLVSLAFVASLLVVMVKLGNPSVPRIVACYYPGALLLPILVFQQKRLDCRKWKIASLVVLSPIIPALVANPARPLIRPDHIASHLGLSRNSVLMERIFSVYEIYEARSDAHRKVREALPEKAYRIGFAGTDGDSSYSFWLPLGERHLTDITPASDKSVPLIRNLDAIVTSDWGSNDRFGITPEELAKRIGWRIYAEVPVRRMVRDPAIRWSILVPGNPPR